MTPRSEHSYPAPDPKHVQRALHAMHERRARLRRNRIFIGAAAALLAVIVAVAGSVAASSPPDQRGRIIVTNPASTTTKPTTEVTIPPTVPVSLRPLGQIPNAEPLYAQRFTWGTGQGSVGFEAGNQSAPVGPLAFTADARGNVVIFDVVNRRLVERIDTHEVPYPVDTSGFGPDPAVIDTQGRLITVDGRGGLIVVRSGERLAHYEAADLPAASDTSWSLVADGRDVLADSHNNSRLRLLHDDGTGYAPARDAKWEPDPVYVNVRGRDHPTIGEFSLRAPWLVDVLPARHLLTDGTIVAVLTVHDPSNVTPIGDPGEYAHLILAIDRLGHAAVARFPAPNAYMDTGPVFQLTDDYFAVMSDTAQSGVTVAAYRYPTPGGVAGDRTAAGSIPYVEQLVAERRLPHADAVERAWADGSVIALTTTLTDRSAAQDLYEQLSRNAGCDDSFMLVNGYRVELLDGSTVTAPRPEFVTCAGT
jgi:hypothetical protein